MNLHFVIYQINLKDKLAAQGKKIKCTVHVWYPLLSYEFIYTLQTPAHHLNREVSFSLLGFSQGDHCSVIVSSDATAGKTLADGVHGMKKKLRKVSISSR